MMYQCLHALITVHTQLHIDVNAMIRLKLSHLQSLRDGIGTTSYWEEGARAVSNICLLNQAACKLKLKDWEAAKALCSCVIEDDPCSTKARWVERRSPMDP